MQRLPLLHQRIVSIHKERVIKLLAQLLLQRPEAGEIHHEAASIQPSGSKPERKTAAVAVHKAAMPGVLPLSMATGIALEVLAAGVTSGRRRHQAEERKAGQDDSACQHLHLDPSSESKAAMGAHESL